MEKRIFLPDLKIPDILRIYFKHRWHMSFHMELPSRMCIEHKSMRLNTSLTPLPSTGTFISISPNPLSRKPLSVELINQSKHPRRNLRAFTHDTSYTRACPIPTGPRDEAPGRGWRGPCKSLEKGSKNVSVASSKITQSHNYNPYEVSKGPATCLGHPRKMLPSMFLGVLAACFQGNRAMR